MVILFVSGKMKKELWGLVRAILLDRRLVFLGFLLLALVFLDYLVLHSIVSELDILEHFLFGFVLSECVSKAANSVGLNKLVSGKMGWKDSWRADFLVRLLGFFLVGGVLWEFSERFVFPLFGFSTDPFFSFPITLSNVDGAVDVAVGALGSVVAWYLKKS